MPASVAWMGTEPEAFLYSKDHGSQSTEAEHSVFGPYINQWQKPFCHPSLGCSSAMVQRPGLESHSFELTKWLRLTSSGEGSSGG